MIVYVESNFILEIARRQSQAESAERILQLKDFKDPGIISELNSYNCRYEQSFGKGLNYIR
jgi:hypothetical protein